jgi:hypothetical protein
MDEDHPRKAVRRAINHRGGAFYDTKQGNSIRISFNAPKRADYDPLDPSPYPDDETEGIKGRGATWSLKHGTKPAVQHRSRHVSPGSVVWNLEAVDAG